MAIRALLKNQIKLGQSNSMRYYHYKTSGRALTGNPEVQDPPTQYFRYHYLPDTYPDALCGVRYSKRDPFEVQQVFAYETWEYQYEGQWWDIGSLFYNIMWFTSPVWIYMLYANENRVSSARRGNRTTNYHTQHGFYYQQAYNYPIEPIIKEEI